MMVEQGACPKCGWAYSATLSRANDRTEYECGSYESPNDPGELVESNDCLIRQLAAAQEAIHLVWNSSGGVELQDYLDDLDEPDEWLTGDAQEIRDALKLMRDVAAEAAKEAKHGK